MLLAQINRDSQGIAEFHNAGSDTQEVTLCLAEGVAISGEITWFSLHCQRKLGQEREYFRFCCTTKTYISFDPMSKMAFSSCMEIKIEEFYFLQSEV